jgi:hypothetical protein
MPNHRTFCRNAKKFSPKQHRERVGAMSGKPCPLHDVVPPRNRACKQSTNPLDICPKHNANRSKCAYDHRLRAQPARTARRALMRFVLARVRRSTAAAPPPTPPPLRHDGTDHLPEQIGISYGSVGGASTFSGVQTTINGGFIRPPSTVAHPAGSGSSSSSAMAPPAASGSSSSSSAACLSTAAAAAPLPSTAQREASAHTTAMLMAAGRMKTAGKLPMAGNTCAATGAWRPLCT